MKITINDHRKVFAIQEEFNMVYRNLKLVFYSKPHKKDGAPAEEFSNENNATVGACRIIHNKGDITITPSMKVMELEERFADVYGLSVRVYRKLGKEWTNTPDASGLTLEELNKQAKPKKQTSVKA
ncbi:MAG: hypothetical protein ACOVPB_07420 [Bacteroidia bacterium]|jgi:hypothetical protein